MSKITPDCIICHDLPATDRFGWCDKCAHLYDEPAEPSESDMFEAAFTHEVIRAIFQSQVEIASSPGLKLS